MVKSNVYLNVPYAEKDAAKALGARWDPAKKKWYAPAVKDISLFSKWKAEPNLSTATVKKLPTGTAVKNSSQGVTTYAKDKNFVAYNGEQPPWD